MLGRPDSPGRTLCVRLCTPSVLVYVAFAGGAVVAAVLLYDRSPDSTWVLGAAAILLVLAGTSTWNRRVVTVRPESITLHRPLPKASQASRGRESHLPLRVLANASTGLYGPDLAWKPPDNPLRDASIPFDRIHRFGQRGDVLVVLLEGRPGGAVSLHGLSPADRQWLLETLARRIGPDPHGNATASR